MEQILTSKKIVERNLSIIKYINDKYVLYKDENKITVDDQNPNVSSVYGVTTIDKLMSVKGYGEVPYLIVITDDPKKEPYFVTSIPTKDLEKLKNGVVPHNFENYNFPYSVDENACDADMVYVLVCAYDFTMRDIDEKLIPLPISLDYIDNEHYDLDKVLEIIKDNPLRFVTVYGGDASLIKIDGDEDEDSIKFITCKYLPTAEEYNEFFYSNTYSWYDKIFDKWFSKCKKENDRLIVIIV